MKMRLRNLLVRTRRTTERIDFSEVVTYLHGPVGTGKSTTARLVDYCLGGDLERTPALRQEFVAAELALQLGDYDCTIERAADDTQSVRVSWSGPSGDMGSVNAPLGAQPVPLIDAEVFNLSDLVFHLCGVSPIKVRKSRRDPDSPLIRLSFRDIWWYCYLDQIHLDSSSFRLEDPFKGRKSQDAMRFFTGLHSERLSQLDNELMKAVDEQRGKREAVQQIRSFMSRFELGSETDLAVQLEAAESDLVEAEERRAAVQLERSSLTHPTDSLRETLRKLGRGVADLQMAVQESRTTIAEQEALRAELITAKIKAAQVDEAKRVLEGVRYERCPQCGSDVSGRQGDVGWCFLCGSASAGDSGEAPMELEALRRDLNERIDQIGDSIDRRERELHRTMRQMGQAEEEKTALDRRLQEELARYDSTFVESIRDAERESATLAERIKSLKHLQQMPQAVNDLEEQAGALQGRIDSLRTSMREERNRLNKADANIAAIADEFKRVMLAVSFPGVSEEDEIVIDPRNWKPTVVHGEQEWTFWDVGSGGKKTLFNVCYALAVHAVAPGRHMPVPGLLIIDSPTKNISEDEDPELVQALYAEIYRLAMSLSEDGLQFLLIDSDLVDPPANLRGFSERRMAGDSDAPSLIPYYQGP